jgi:DNA-binding response OmpR family regulator
MKTAEEYRVLVVDDDRFFQRVLEKRLSAERYQVTCAADGREGMKAIVAWEPDLVLSDWMMPEVDGLELCQSVKTGLGDSAPYFILLTAKGEISDRLLGLQTGADDYLVKPCDHGELLARIRAGLRIVTLTKELRHTVAELQGANHALAQARAELIALSGLRAACPGCGQVLGAGGEWRAPATPLGAEARALLELAACPACLARSQKAA